MVGGIRHAVRSGRVRSKKMEENIKVTAIFLSLCGSCKKKKPLRGDLRPPLRRAPPYAHHGEWGGPGSDLSPYSTQSHRRFEQK
jgi:hypothetical protein